MGMRDTTDERDTMPERDNQSAGHNRTSIYGPSELQLATLTQQVKRMYGASSARVVRVEVPYGDDGELMTFANGRAHAFEVTVSYTLTRCVCHPTAKRVGRHSRACVERVGVWPLTWHSTWGFSRGQFELWAD